MKLAIRNNEIYKNYSERFSDDIITAEPYNYQIAKVPDNINLNDIVHSDFDIIDGEYNFNIEKHISRIEKEKEINNLNNYKIQINSLIRERYSYNDEIAILRQRDTKTNEFNEYYNFVENVKLKVKSSFNNL